MSELKVITLEAVTIPDAWFQSVWAVMDHGFTYDIDQGSFAGSEKRYELDFLTVKITKPWTPPLEPDIPLQYNIPAPVPKGYIEEQYVAYLMTGAVQSKEDYTYGERMVAAQKWGRFPTGWKDTKGDEIRDYMWIKGEVINQVEFMIDRLKNTPRTNQAILQVGQPSDCLLDDPPCLRHIDMRLKDGKLIFYPYFRSWDLWSGFPANLGGMVYLQEYMCGEIGCERGEFICSSKGVHIYEYAWQLAEMRTGKKVIDE